MSRDVLLYLNDIRESIAKIIKYTDGMSYEQFTTNDMAIDAVIRNFEIIGEASAHISDDVQSACQDIPWFKMKGMRNLVAHEYYKVDLLIVWDTARDSLPILGKQINQIIDELS